MKWQKRAKCFLTKVITSSVPTRLIRSGKAWPNSYSQTINCYLLMPHAAFPGFRLLKRAAGLIPDAPKFHCESVRCLHWFARRTTIVGHLLKHRLARYGYPTLFSHRLSNSTHNDDSVKEWLGASEVTSAKIEGPSFSVTRCSPQKIVKRKKTHNHTGGLTGRSCLLPAKR